MNWFLFFSPFCLETGGGSRSHTRRRLVNLFSFFSAGRSLCLSVFLDFRRLPVLFVDMQGSSGDMVALTVLLMQQHQGNDGVVTAGMELLGALAYNLAQAGYEPHPKLAVRRLKSRRTTARLPFIHPIKTTLLKRRRRSDGKHTDEKKGSETPSSFSS